MFAFAQRALVFAAIGAAIAFTGALSGCSTAPQRAAQNAPSNAAHEQAVIVPAGDLRLTGVLFTPSDPPLRAERRPAIVLMHGCGGMADARGALVPRHRDWAERFASWGFVALTLDSFSARGVRSLCELKERPVQPWSDRTRDAYAALDYLVGRSDVDPNAVFVLGWSHGGSTVMGVVRPQAPGRKPTGPHFKAAIAFYPGCISPLQQNSWRPTMPLMILHGEADDWTPAAPCVELAQKMKSQGLPVQTITYAGAHHGFDAPGNAAVRYLPKVFNPAAPGERGAHIGPDPQARRAATDEVKRFVERQL